MGRTRKLFLLQLLCARRQPSGRQNWRFDKMVKRVIVQNCWCTTYSAPRIGGRDNEGGKMSLWGPSPSHVLQIHSLHQVDMGTPSHVPRQRRVIIVAIFRGLGPIVWSLQIGTWHRSAFVVPISYLISLENLQFCRLVATRRFEHLAVYVLKIWRQTICTN